MKDLLLTCLIPLLSLPNPVPIIPIPINAGSGIEAGRLISMAERRADEYRNLYEYCDEHHNCMNRTAGNKAEEKKNSQDINAAPKPFLHPIFQFLKSR